MVRLSKSTDYLIDNIFVIMLSVVKARGQGESRQPAEPVANWESRAHFFGGTRNTSRFAFLSTKKAS
jgi:hypothetical protein